MTLAELEYRHFSINEEEIDIGEEIKQHTKLSMEFAISVLEDLNITMFELTKEDYLYLKVLENKTQELKQYLSETNKD